MVFVIVMDWILKQAIDGVGGGLEWLDGNRIWTLPIMFHYSMKLGVECNNSPEKREEEASKVGLHKSTANTKMVQIGNF